MAVKDRVPKQLRAPVGFASIAVMILGLVVGYIFTMLGVMLYFDLELEVVTKGESLVVLATGIAMFAVAYGGWKGFNYFAY